jgi:hypothetical protein
VCPSSKTCWQTNTSTMLFPPVAKEDLAEKLLNWR